MVRHEARATRRFVRTRLFVSLSVLMSASIYVPSAGAATIPVQNCDDSGVGSLRDALGAALDGDTVDLSQLPSVTGCAADGRDAVITLASPLTGTFGGLTLMGPPARNGTVTISGNQQIQVLKISAFDIRIRNLTIRDGLDTSGRGGCIANISPGNVELIDSLVTGCVTHASGTMTAKGGGIYSAGGVTLVESTVSGNAATSDAGFAFGGGLYALHGFGNGIGRTALLCSYSTVSNNTVSSGQSVSAFGGGVATRVPSGESADTVVENSTIEGNASNNDGGGMYLTNTTTIKNSTISGNQSDRFGLAVALRSSSFALTLMNSTVAFNTGAAGGGIEGIIASVELQSSIVANNSNSDLALSMSTTVSGSNNLVEATFSPLPPGVALVGVDPMLKPLSFNGGPTRTHLLLRGSPAIGAGNNSIHGNFDQRGFSYPRESAGITDIGAVQFDTIFKSGFP